MYRDDRELRCHRWSKSDLRLMLLLQLIAGGSLAALLTDHFSPTTFMVGFIPAVIGSAALKRKNRVN